MTWALTIGLPLLLAFVVPVARLRPGWYGAVLGAAALPALYAGMAGAAPAQMSWLLLESSFGLDGTRRVLLSFTALLWGIAGVYAGAYLAHDRSRGPFAFFFLLTMAGNLALVAAEDVPGFYTGFVLMTFASYGLVIHNRSHEALRAGRIYLVMAILGELFLLAGIYLVVAAADSLLLVDMGAALAEMPLRNPALLLLLAGFGVKAGAVPLYFWLPLAHPVAPTPASAVLSGAMIKAGLLGWIHFSPAGSAPLPGWSGVLIALGLIAAFGAVVIGLFQTDPKTNLAYSSISQMGLMTVLFGIGLAATEARDTTAPALALYAWNHGLAKGALFLGVGVALAADRAKGWVLAGLALPALTIAGAPFTGGAFTKYALKEAVAFTPGAWSDPILWLLPLSALGTSLLLGRFLLLTWKKMGSEAGHGSFRGLATSWLVLLGIVAIGVPWARGHFGLETPVPSASPEQLFDSAWPVAVAAGLLFWAARILKGKQSLPTVPPGDFLLPIERLVSAVRDIWRHRGLPDLRQGAINFVPIVDRILALEGTWRIVDRVERRLGSWNVVGFLFALIALGFILILG